MQNSGLQQYRPPDTTLRDADKRLGFPHLDGFLAAAVREVNSPGLNLPWYSAVGNHDTMPLGCFASQGDPRLTERALGGRKPMDLPAAEAHRLQQTLRKAKDPRGVRHVDFPRLARVVEPADNEDGTLSLLTPLVESSAPYRTGFTDLSRTGPAGLHRELSFNAAGSKGTEAANRGTATPSWC